MEKAQALLAQKDALEDEICELERELRGHGVGRTEPLVDREGFPRADVDVAAVRQLRQSLNCKQNDLRALMGEVEGQLVALHQSAKAEAAGPADEQPEKSRRPQRPFARVSIVTPGSPASEAGLLVGDKIVSYGAVDASNHSNLQALAAETLSNINRPMPVTVQRVVDGVPRTVDLVLRLRHGWGGESLLGCHILPLPT
ncbi:putative 26S proteasome regulatory subunit [Coemansia javaensis]|uniref:Probable 26S proteasome regulatory subunit p27 n=1 Tax=Coemansia javaensis TaxID=2761396 RepID=A0A9W8LMJ4_9FUNG|nr:putative 26S proteasome regulatory subunit [Coemansia javaensis]